MGPTKRPPGAPPSRSRRHITNSIESGDDGFGSALRLAARSVSSAAKILLDLPLLPSGAEETADAKEHDARDRHGDARAQHRPVEPEGLRAVVEHVDREPHQAEGNPDGYGGVEDALTTDVSPSFLELLAHATRISWGVFLRPDPSACFSPALRSPVVF